MSSRIGQIPKSWSDQETDRLNSLLSAGWTAEQIAADLGRTVGAINTRRRRIASYEYLRRPQSLTKPKPKDRARLDALVKTTAAAASQRKMDEALVTQLRGGLLWWLAAVHGVKTRTRGLSSLRSQHSAVTGGADVNT